MKTLVIVFSYHHKNTEKIAQVIAKVLDAPIKTPQQIPPEELQEYDLIGFGSGIYSSKHHESLLDLAERLLQVSNKKSFLFSTCGAPAFAVDGGHVNDYVVKAHSALKEKLQLKGYTVVNEFMCPGFNTNSFLKFFGGINKGRPNSEDLKHAEEFAMNLKKNIHGL
jgi:flavodoxin